MKPISCTVFILAGGLATRLHPITHTMPKSMVPVAGAPFIHHQLQLLAAQQTATFSIRQVVLCTGFLGDAIEAFVGDGSRYGLKVAYSSDGPELHGPKLLGTGGALIQAAKRFNSAEIALVLYGDSYLPGPYAPIVEAFQAASAYQALMTVFANGNQWDTSNVVWDGQQILAYDKAQKNPQEKSIMQHIDWGLGLWQLSELQAEAIRRVDLAQLYQHQLALGRLMGYEVSQRFYEMGSHTGLNELEQLLLG